jgi:hypothetical protein
MTLKLVESWFSKLPPAEQDLPLLVVGGVAYSPRAALQEVRRGTELGSRLQTLIESGSFGTPLEQEEELAKIRLKQILQSMPEKPTFATLQLPVGREYTPQQIVEEIQRGTNIGKQWIRAELAQMRYIIRVR